MVEYVLIALGWLFYGCLAAGAIWHLTRKSRYRIAHLLCGVLLLGALLGLAAFWVRNSFADPREQARMMFLFGACFLPLVSYGIDTGSRNEAACHDLPALVRWLVFLCGLVLVFAMLAFLVLPLLWVGALLGDGEASEVALLSFLFILSLTILLTTGWCRVRARKLKEADVSFLDR